MAAAQSEIRYLTPPSVDVKKKKYCRFKKKLEVENIPVLRTEIGVAQT